MFIVKTLATLICVILCIPLLEINTSPLKIGRVPNQPSLLNVRFREGTSKQLSYESPPIHQAVKP